jgi:predicted GNAT family acetyltransferase
MENEYVVEHNKEQSKFQVKFDSGEIAFIDYKLYPGKIMLIHTQVPEDMAGKGFAGFLAKYALNYAKSENLRVHIYCSFIAGYVLKHKEYNGMIDYILP